jgi:O-succinylbenzoic acid--CoA ligase
MAGRVIVVEAHGVPGFVENMRRAWDDGDAVLPVDPRLPPAARRHVVAAARPDEPCGDRDALIVATSGTTGPPKAVVLTHEAVAASARATSDRLGVDSQRDRWLACLPLAHVGGLGVVTRALDSGVPCTVVDRADAVTIASAAAAGCTLVALVPTLLTRVDPAAFRVVLLGGSAPPATLPPNAVTTYGMTETAGGVVYNGVPLDGVDIRVVDGEIHVRGSMLLRAYRDGTDPKHADGWLATGDLGTWDTSSGRLRVTGRKGDLIISGGENVSPTTVEAALASHPAVREVLVFGRHDATWGQRVVARVVPAHPGDPPKLDALRGHVKETLPAWAAPLELEIVEALPRTGTGKLKRPRPRESS